MKIPWSTIGVSVVWVCGAVYTAFGLHSLPQFLVCVAGLASTLGIPSPFQAAK